MGTHSRGTTVGAKAIALDGARKAAAAAVGAGRGEGGGGRGNAG